MQANMYSNCEFKLNQKYCTEKHLYINMKIYNKAWYLNVGNS